VFTDPCVPGWINPDAAPLDVLLLPSNVNRRETAVGLQRGDEASEWLERVRAEGACRKQFRDCSAPPIRFRRTLLSHSGPFVTALQPDGKSLVYSTLLAAVNVERRGHLVDPAGTHDRWKHQRPISQ